MYSVLFLQIICVVEYDVNDLDFCSFLLIFKFLLLQVLMVFLDCFWLEDMFDVVCINCFLLEIWII